MRQRACAAVLPVAGAVLCLLLALGGAQGKDADLFAEVQAHHFHVAAHTGSVATAPSLHELEMRAVARLHSRVMRPNSAKEPMHSMSEVAQGSLLADAEKEMQQEEGKDAKFSSQRMPGSHDEAQDSTLAVDEDHGHVPTKIVEEALKLAQQRDGPALPATRTPSQPMPKAMSKSLLAKALKEQQSDFARVGKYDRAQAPSKHASEAAEAVDKDHGRVSLKWIKLAEKLAKQQGQSMEQDKTSSIQLVNWKSEAEDKMHGKVADWQIALMKKAQAERQQDDEKLNKPLAQAMQKEGYISDKHAHTEDKMKALAVDHTKLEDTKKLANLAMKVQKERNDDDQNVEKPLARQMVKEGYLKDEYPISKLSAKESKIAKDTTQLHPGKADYVKEAKAAEADREADADKLEKNLAHDMVKQGYMKQKGLTAQQKRMSALAKDTTQMQPNKLDGYVEEVKAAEGNRKEDFAKKQEPLYQQMKSQGYVKKTRTGFQASAKDTTQLHPQQAVDYVKEAKEAEADRNEDADKLEKPLAVEMMRQGYLHNQKRMTMQDRAIDRTNMKNVDMQEVSGLAGKARLHPHMPKGTPQLHSTQAVDYVKEANEAEADRNEDADRLEKPLAVEMTRQGYLHNKLATMQDRAVDHTNMKNINMKEMSGLAGKARLHPHMPKGTPEHTQQAVDYVKEAKVAEADRNEDADRLEKPLAVEMTRQGYLHNKIATMRDRAIDHTNLKYLDMEEVSGLEGRAKVHLQMDKDMTNLHPKQFVDSRAIDHTNLKNIDMKEVSGLAGEAKLHLYNSRKGPADQTKLTHLDDDDNKMAAATMKDIAKITGAQFQDDAKVLPIMKLSHGPVTTDYVKEAMEAKAERDADDKKLQQPLANEMTRQGYLRRPGQSMAERAVDHTSMPKQLNGNAKNGVGQKLSHSAQAARIAEGQADFLKDDMKAKAMKDIDDAALEAPLAKEMVKQGYLKAHKRTALYTGKPLARPPVHPVTKLSPQPDASPQSRKEEAEKLLRIVNRSVWHDSSARESPGKKMQFKQTQLLTLAMKAEKEKGQEDHKIAQSMSRDLTGKKQQTSSMKDTIKTSNHLIEHAIKEQDEEMATGNAEMRKDDAALVTTDAHDVTGRHSVVKTGDNLLKQALKEARADHAKGEDMRDRDVNSQQSVHTTRQHAVAVKGKMHNVQQSLIQQAIAEKDSEMKKGMREEEHDDRIAEEVHVDKSRDSGNQRTTGEKNSLLQLARQAMGEIDQDEAAKRARQIHDDKAEDIVHQEHVEARQKKGLSSEVSVEATVKPQLKSRDSMLLLIRKADSEISKDESLAKSK